MCQRSSSIIIIIIVLTPLHHCYFVSCFMRAIPISACQTAPPPPPRRRRCFLRVQINRILIPHRLFPGKKER